MARLPPFAQAAAAAGIAAGATALCLWLDGFMSLAGLAMVYLVAVASAAATLGRAASAGVSLLCVSALNFFFVPPRGSFAVDGAESWWLLAVMLAVSLGMNTLVSHLREGRARAEAGELRAARLHDLGEALAACSSNDAMAERAAGFLHEALGHPCAVYVGTQAWHAPSGLHEFHPRSAQWAIEQGRPLGRGCADWPALPLWCAPFSRHGAGGAVQVLLPDAAQPDAAHWLDLARQVGLSIERERAAQAARAAGDSARAEAARNTLLASLSHDLRTPLSGIVGNASALRVQSDTLSPAQRERLLLNLENDARDMERMADNVLQLARLSQPHAQLATQWEAVEDILGSAVARMRQRWPQARIRLAVPADLPPVRADAGLLAQAIANLVDNAVRHGGESPHIAIQAGRSREGVFIAVRDHGKGIIPAELAGIFERWHRGDGDRAAHGAGLGLAICELVAQGHGGSIAARACEPGVEFRIDLPLEPPGTPARTAAP